VTAAAPRPAPARNGPPPSSVGAPSPRARRTAPPRARSASHRSANTTRTRSASSRPPWCSSRAAASTRMTFLVSSARRNRACACPSLVTNACSHELTKTDRRRASRRAHLHEVVSSHGTRATLRAWTVRLQPPAPPAPLAAVPGSWPAGSSRLTHVRTGSTRVRWGEHRVKRTHARPAPRRGPRRTRAESARKRGAVLGGALGWRPRPCRTISPPVCGKGAECAFACQRQ
jgi:hypothetical protein